jgi:hypothetical protein
MALALTSCKGSNPSSTVETRVPLPGPEATVETDSVTPETVKDEDTIVILNNLTVTAPAGIFGDESGAMKLR